MYKRILLILLAVLLSACGGGGGGGAAPSVSQIQAQSLKYGHQAVIYVAGKYLRSDMLADTASCTNPSFSPSSTPNAAILNCSVSATGALPISIKAASGELLFATTLTVPQPQVTVVTSQGTLLLELNPDVVPATVNNFLSYVSTGFYTGTLFHRVIAAFVVQAGGYSAGLVKKTGQLAPIALETNKGLSNTRGTLAMARTPDPNSATSEFYINLVDNPVLDYQDASNPGYAVFGKVISGLDVVDAIGAAPTGSVNAINDVPLADITITSATQTR